MKKPVFDESIYSLWEPVSEKVNAVEAYNKELLKKHKKREEITAFMILSAPRGPVFQDVYPLFSRLRTLPRAFTGKSRKVKDDLVLVPREILQYVLDRAFAGVPSGEQRRSEEAEHE